MTHSRFRRFALAGAAFATILISVPVAAQGDLLIAPTRVIISQGGSAEVILSNIGVEPATYRISVELRRMGEDGDFTKVSEAEATPAELAALQMVTYAPRRIALLPEQPQAVRISIRPPAGLPTANTGCTSISGRFRLRSSPRQTAIRLRAYRSN